jgi:AraC-like DNA-binding protein
MIFDSDITTHSSPDQMHGHRHKRAYVALVLEGGYRELSADGAWSLEPGDVVVHPPYHFHANSFNGRTNVLNLRVPEALSDEEEFRSYSVMRPACDHHLLRAGDVAAVREVLHQAEEVAPGEPCDWVDSMARDLATDFSARIKDLAQTYSVTMEHASRRFRQRYLMTPSTLRSERRFRHALTLLQRTKHSLSEIAHMAGYSDQPHFSRSCQRITGFSPGKLRGRSC